MKRFSICKANPGRLDLFPRVAHFFVVLERSGHAQGTLKKPEHDAISAGNRGLFLRGSGAEFSYASPRKPSRWQAVDPIGSPSRRGSRCDAKSSCVGGGDVSGRRSKRQRSFSEGGRRTANLEPRSAVTLSIGSATSRRTITRPITAGGTLFSGGRQRGALPLVRKPEGSFGQFDLDDYRIYRIAVFLEIRALSECYVIIRHLLDDLGSFRRLSTAI